MDLEIIVPDGWVHIPTTPEYSRLRERTINRIVSHALPDTLPRDKAGPWRRMLRKELTDATDEAQRQGARALVVPVAEMHGMRLPGTLVLTVIEEEEDEAQDPATVLDAIVADAGPDGMLLEVDGCPAARVRSVISSEPLGRKAPSIRIGYYVAAPDAPGTWGLLTFTVLTDGDLEAEAVQAIVLLFDMVVCGMRWVDEVAVPTEDELLALSSGT